MENINIMDNYYDNEGKERNTEPMRVSTAIRICAFMIDHIIITFIVVIPFVLFSNIDGDTVRVIVAFPILMLICFFIYCLKDIAKGRSPGKYILGLAVRNRSDTSQVPSVGKLFLRNIFTLMWPIDILILLSSESRLKLGDSIAETDVYRITNKPKVLIIVIAAVLTFTIFISLVVFGSFAVLRSHPSYQAAIHYIETNPRIIELVGDIEGFGSFPSGIISSSGGYGQAEFVIRIIGSENTVYARLVLLREPLRDREVVAFSYRY